MKERERGDNNRVRYSLLVILVSVILACFSFLPFSSSFEPFLFKTFVLSAYFIVGIIHLLLQIKRIPEEGSPNLSFTIKLSLFTFITLFTFYFFLNRPLSYLALGSSAAFILPFIVYSGFIQYSSIPAKVYKVWYPKDNSISNKAIIFANSLPIRFKVACTETDRNYSSFKTIAPTQMSLGKVFQAFLIQLAIDKRPIEQEYEPGKMYGWQFFAEGFFGLTRTPLDPDLNLWENNIKPKTTVLAKRTLEKQEKLEQALIADKIEDVMSTKL